MKKLLLIVLFAGMVMAQTARNFRTVFFSNLGSPTANNIRYCVDCQVGAPCASGGLGAYAYATGSQWNCTDHAPGGSGSGSVTSVGASSSASGLTLSVTNPTTTPSVSLTGTPNIAASNITSGTVATARLGSGTASSSTFLRGDSTWVAGGSVSSVGLSVPAEFSVSGSPVTGSGTLTFTKASQNANLVFAGPTTGSAAAPGFRLLVAADLPSITESKFSFSDITTANASASAHGLLPKLSGNGSDCLRGDGTFSTCPGAGTGGDFSTNTTLSTTNQVVVASGSGGKTGTFFTGTGLASTSSGVLSAVSTSSGIASAISDETGSGSLVFATSPTLTTPTISSFVNATHNHTSAATGGQLTLGAFSSTTGSGAIVGATSPVLVTPNVGVASASSINKVAITAPATSATLTIANGKTATFNNSITFSGSDSTTMTFPSTSGSVVTNDSTATLTNKTLTLPVLGGNSGPPATCTVGQMFRDTSVSPNAYYKCISTNTWGQELVSGTVGAVATGNGGTGTVNPSGTITISGATSGSATFGTAFGTTPRCIVTPTTDLGGVRFWITRSTTALTVNTSSSVTTTFDYVCLAQ